MRVGQPDPGFPVSAPEPDATNNQAGAGHVVIDRCPICGVGDDGDCQVCAPLDSGVSS